MLILAFLGGFLGIATTGLAQTQHTVQHTAPSLDQLQVVELPPDSASGTVLQSYTAPTLNSAGQTAPSGSGNGPLHESHNTRARAPKPGRNN